MPRQTGEKSLLQSHQKSKRPDLAAMRVPRKLQINLPSGRVEDGAGLVGEEDDGPISRAAVQGSAEIFAIGVSVAPGKRAFTRMFCWPQSSAAARTSPLIPDLLAQ